MSTLTKGIFIVAAKRTPFGSMGGKLMNMSPTDMQEVASKAALAAGKIDPKIVDSIVIGNIISDSAADGVYVARHVGIRCGIPQASPALIINRLCGSGFQAVVNGAHDIMIGDSKVVLTGGTENMSLSPYVLRGSRYGTRLGMDLKLEDQLWNGLTDLQVKLPMGMTAENLAVKYNISREEAEEYAVGSQQKWKKAHDAGHFKDEIAPVKVKVRGKEVVVDTDEHPKPQTTKEGLAKLPPVFKKGGTVTAGTASGVCDGAGAVIIASEEAVKEHNLSPIARLVSYGISGCDPAIMGIGPVPSIQKALKAAGKTLEEMELIEINEAFAPQVLACAKELKIDMSKFNVDGGAIALGHPLGASGARITAHICHSMRQRGAKISVASACLGGGQGIALVLERV